MQNKTSRMFEKHKCPLMQKLKKLNIYMYKEALIKLVVTCKQIKCQESI